MTFGNKHKESVSFVIDKRVIARLREYKTTKGVPISAVIELLVEKYLDKMNIVPIDVGGRFRIQENLDRVEE